jgi:hypothetical protein
MPDQPVEILGMNPVIIRINQASVIGHLDRENVTRLYNTSDYFNPFYGTLPPL